MLLTVSVMGRLEALARERIIKLRKQHQVSQERLGQAADPALHQTTVGKWEKGDLSVSVDTLDQWARFFGRTLFDLVAHDDISGSMLPDVVAAFNALPDTAVRIHGNTWGVPCIRRCKMKCNSESCNHDRQPRQTSSGSPAMADLGDPPRRPDAARPAHHVVETRTRAVPMTDKPAPVVGSITPGPLGTRLVIHKHGALTIRLDGEPTPPPIEQPPGNTQGNTEQDSRD